MLKGLLTIIIILIGVVAIVGMIAVRFLYRSISNLRDAARAAMGMDGTGSTTNRDETGRRSRQYAYNERTDGRSRSSQNASSSARHTTTASGETIIDGRNPEHSDRKIFAESEGEYVDFEEVK